MEDKGKVFNVMVPEKYIGRDKVERTSYFQVGVGFATKDGTGVSVRLGPGISLSGQFLILPRKDREETQQPETAAAPSVGDDFPL